MKKIVLIVGARPNFMKAFPVYQVLKNNFELTLIHTGQHFDAKMSDIFFNQLGFPVPDVHLDLESKSRAGELDSKLYVNNIEYLKDKNQVIEDLIDIDFKKLGQMGEIRAKLEIEFEKIKPELVMVFGDVTSTLAASLAAKKLGIEIAHVESGLRSGDLTMPEEVNRILTDHITTYYFVTEQSGIDNLKNEGIEDNVYLVGNTMIDCLYMFKDKALETKYHEKIGLRSKEYILITLHRPSNVDNLDKLKEIFDDLFELAKNEKLVYPIHPRTKSNLEKIGYLEKINLNSNIILEEPLGYLEFTCLESNSKYVITDSGGIQEETTALNVPCFTLRENTERPSTLIVNGGTNMLISDINKINDFTNIKLLTNINKFSRDNILLHILNIEKKKLLILNKSQSKINQDIGLRSKIMTNIFCKKNEIETPEPLFIKSKKYNYKMGRIVDCLNKEYIVLKIDNNCSTYGCYLLKKINSNEFYCKFKNNKYTNEEIVNLIHENDEIICEEYLHDYDDNIPLDYKCYTIGGKIHYIIIINRNFKNTNFCVYDNICKKFLKKDDWCYYSTIEYNYFENHLLENLNKVYDFVKKISNDYNVPFVSYDLYIIKKKILLGEITLHPGLLHHSIIKISILKNLNKNIYNYLFKNSYQIQTIHIDDISNDLVIGKYHYIYKNIDFLYNKENKKNLLITFHGSRKKTTQLPIFRYYNDEYNDYDIISFSDPLPKYNNDIELGWYIKNEYLDTPNLLIEIISQILYFNKYNNVIFYGSSGGGYISLILGSYFEKFVLITNSQIYLEKYFYYNKLKKIVNDISYVNVNDYLKIHKPKKIFLYQNKNDIEHYSDHCLNFINNNLNIDIELTLFERNDIKILYDQHGLGHFPINTYFKRELIKNFSKKILIIQNNLYIGGAQKYGLDIIKSLKEKNITLLIDCKITDEEKKKFYEYTKCLYCEFIEMKLNDFLHKNKTYYDYIFINSYPMVFSNELNNLLKKIENFGNKIYLICHNETNRFTLSVSQLTKLNKNKFEIICVFNRLKKKFDKIINLNTHVLYPSFEKIKNIKNNLNNINNTKILGYYGRILENKGLFLLIKYWKLLHIYYPEWKLKVIGNYTTYSKSYYDEIINYVNENNLKNIIEFDTRDIINENEKNSVFQGIDVFIQLSLYEGFPFTVLESLSKNTPVIHTNVGGLNEINNIDELYLLNFKGTNYENFDFIDYHKTINQNLSIKYFDDNMIILKEKLDIVLNKTIKKININELNIYDFINFSEKLNNLIN